MKSPNICRLALNLIQLSWLWHSVESSAVPSDLTKEQCEQDPMAVNLSPGFITGILPYLGHEAHLCTDSGVCRNVPHVCTLSSCCITDKISNTVLPSALVSLGSSHCGCWDTKRKSCQPVQRLHVEWSGCDNETGIPVHSTFQLASSGSRAGGRVFNGSSAKVNFDVNEKGNFRIRITTEECSKRLAKQVRLLPPGLGGDLGFHLQVKDDFQLHIKGKLREEFYPLILRVMSFVTKQTTHFNPLPNGFLTFLHKNFPINASTEARRGAQSHCQNELEISSISVSPTFLAGTLGNLNLLGEAAGSVDVCGVQGECRLATTECSKSCCHLSIGKSSVGCECINRTMDTNCVLGHKMFKMGETFCTETGEKVTRLTRITSPPSQVSSNCNNGETWPATSVFFDLNADGSLELIVDTKQCLLSAMNQQILEMEMESRAEINIDQFQNALEQYINANAGK